MSYQQPAKSFFTGTPNPALFGIPFEGIDNGFY
jgi:hypothetical protein